MKMCRKSKIDNIFFSLLTQNYELKIYLRIQTMI